MLRFRELTPAEIAARDGVANKPAAVANSPKPKRDRKDYQRELMRKRRAAAKEQS